jgi:transposase
MIKLNKEQKVYVYSGQIDMRKSIDGLSTMVTEFLKLKFDDSIFVFIGKKRDRVKILYWDVDGYALWYKRLEAGRLKVVNVTELENLTTSELKLFLSGMELERIKYRKKVN